MAKKKHRCKKKRNNNQYSEYNEGGDVSYEMSEADIRTLGLLNLQILMIYITIYAYIILYTSTVQGIELIYSKYNNEHIDSIQADETALQAVYMFFATQLIFTRIAIVRYNILYEEKERGEIDYSLEPNINIISSNIVSIISLLYLIAGAEGVYERDNGQTIFGV